MTNIDPFASMSGLVVTAITQTDIQYGKTVLFMNLPMLDSII
jgi:hypothetical protein